MNMLQIIAQKSKKDEHKNGVAVLDVSFLRIFSGSKGNSMLYFYNLTLSKYLCQASLPWAFFNAFGQF